MEFRDVIRQPAGLIVPVIMAVMVLALRKKPIHIPGVVLVDFFPCSFSPIGPLASPLPLSSQESALILSTTPSKITLQYPPSS